LKHLERTVGVTREHALIRAAVARLQAIQLPDGPDRAALAVQLILEACDGLEFPERYRDWDLDLRAALSAVFDQLSIEELRGLRQAASEELPGNEAT
jgi:hypothetical protein